MARKLIHHYPRIELRRANILASHIRQFVNGKTLDLGCGSGLVSNLCSNNLVGIDVIKPNKIEIPFKLFDGENIPFKNKEFDTIVCISVLHHSKNPEKLIKEMRRTGKRVVIMEDKYDSFLSRLSTQTLHVYMLLAIKMPFIISGFKNKHDWKKILEKNKFKIRYMKETSPSFPWPFFKHQLIVAE